MRRLVFRSLLIAFPALLLILMPAVSSAAPFKSTTTVSIKSASLAPGGANVTVSYSCFPSGYGPYSSFGDVRVGQVSGAQGDAFFPPTCNDTKQTQVVFVPGNFTSGGAAVNFFVCGFDCAFTSREVRIK
jgi:hypothetical protein